MKYIISPYLTYGYQFDEKKEKNKIINYLNCRPQIITHIEYKILKNCIHPQEIEFLKKKYDCKALHKLILSKLLLEYDTVWNQHLVTHIEVETSTICNWKCEYCPVRYHTRTPKRMDIELFKTVLTRAQEYKNIRYITLHSYNEPTQDKNFIAYLEEIKRTNLMLVLYTNGSGLDEFKLNYLKNYPNLRNIIITIPSIQRQIFEQKTNSADYDKTIYAIKKSRSLGLKTSLSVQGHGDTQHMQEIQLLKKAFPGIECNHHVSFDRAGTLTNEYFQNIHLSTPILGGCRSIMEGISVNVTGDLFLCCNDFHQNYILGNITKNSIAELLSGPVSSTFRKMIWGGIELDKDFICRHCYLMQLACDDLPIHIQLKNKRK